MANRFNHGKLSLVYLFIMVSQNSCSIIPSEKTARISKGYLNNDSFLYASEYEDMLHHSVAPRASQVSKNATKTTTPRALLPEGKVRYCIGDLCEGLENYPYDEIKAILVEKPGVDIYFDSKKTIDVQIDERFQDDGGESFCATVSHSIFPEKAKNLDKTEKLIVNVEGYKQGIVAETCAVNSKCRFVDSIISGYTTECVQRYTIKRLMAINEDGKPSYDSFEIPSCCMCVLKKVKRK